LIVTDQLGFIGSTTTLSCVGSEITSDSAFVFKKDGTVIYSSDCDVANHLKYIATVKPGQIQLQIKNTAVTDEGVYTCMVNFIKVTYALEVEGKCALCIHLYKISFKRLPSCSECFNCFVRHLGNFVNASHNWYTVSPLPNNGDTSHCISDFHNSNLFSELLGTHCTLVE